MEAEPPSVVGIAITYLLASVASLGCFGLLIYFLAIFENQNESYLYSEYTVCTYIFVALCALLTLGVMLLGCRLLKMRKIQVPIVDGKRALTAYYLIFMLGYMSKVAADIALEHAVDDIFTEEMLYDWCPLVWDGVPIFCLLMFHYKNYKPH